MRRAAFGLVDVHLLKRLLLQGGNEVCGASADHRVILVLQLGVVSTDTGSRSTCLEFHASVERCFGGSSLSLSDLEVSDRLGWVLRLVGGCLDVR